MIQNRDFHAGRLRILGVSAQSHLAQFPVIHAERVRDSVAVGFATRVGVVVIAESRGLPEKRQPVAGGLEIFDALRHQEIPQHHRSREAVFLHQSAFPDRGATRLSALSVGRYAIRWQRQPQEQVPIGKAFASHRLPPSTKGFIASGNIVKSAGLVSSSQPFTVTTYLEART